MIAVDRPAMCHDPHMPDAPPPAAAADEPSIDKSAVLRALCDRVAADLEAAAAAQRATQEGATHEESRPENDKDTRAVEASYLARGQAQRVLEMRRADATLRQVAIRAFEADDQIALTALVTVNDGTSLDHFFLAPAGGGIRLLVCGAEIRVVTPQSPLGRALLGKRAGDGFELPVPRGAKECEIERVT